MIKNLCLVILITLFSGSALAETQALKTMRDIPPKKENQPEAGKASDAATDKNGVQVGDIYVACKYYFSKVFNTRESVSRKNICNGYFFGSASMLLLLQNEEVETNTCIPMDISTEEIIRSFLEWTDKNPDKMKMLASEALLQLLRQNYPCKEYKPGSGINGTKQKP